MVLIRTLFLESKTLAYNELVRITGKDFTDRIRHIFVTPIKIFSNRKPLKAFREALNYYSHSSLRGFKTHELINQYLFSLAFSPAKRLRIAAFQYKFLSDRLTLQQRDMMLESGVRCWRKDFEDCSHSIVLKLSKKYELEGCLSLIYFVGDRDIYIISFTICSGIDFGYDDPFVVLVSRVQGTKGRYDEIAKASKQLIDIYPPASLMSALEGFCISQGIGKMIGIAAKNQVSLAGKDLKQTKDCLEQTKIQYDGFWETFGARPLEESGDYLIQVPFINKSLEHVRSKFRKRTLAKRLIKRDLSDTAKTNCRRLFYFPDES